MRAQADNSRPLSHVALSAIRVYHPVRAEKRSATFPCPACLLVAESRGKAERRTEDHGTPPIVIRRVEQAHGQYA